MKKCLIFLMVLSTFLLCSCGENSATSFESEAINNGYNNFIVGGDMAYKDNNLYVNFYSVDNAKSFGTYRFNDKGVQQIVKDKNSAGDSFLNRPCFYQQNNELFVFQNGDCYSYDESKNKLSKVDFDYDAFEQGSIITDDLTVIINGTSIKVKYKNNSEYIISDDIYKVYVYNNVVYYVNSDGWLYCNDVTKSNSKSQFVSYLNEDTPTHFMVCGDYVYFDSYLAEDDNNKTGLYKYSLSKDEVSLVHKGEINCLNSYNNIMYFSDNNGIYSDNNSSVVAITNRCAKSIYLLDNKYIYAIQNDSGNVYRVTLDGQNTEIIDYRSDTN